MFETLTNTLEGFFGKLKGKPRLSEKNIKDGLKEVRLALLEADVHYKVVKSFTQSVKEKAVGDEVLRGVNPAEQIVKIVHDELVNLMGPVDTDLPIYKESGKPAVIMLAGLQGSGKTTTCGKLVHYLLDKHEAAPILCAADVRRPAAIDQLETLGEQLDVPVVSRRGSDALSVCLEARMEAAQQNRSPLILDTGGRLHIDEQMMGELREIRKRAKPDAVFLVADARTGQDAVTSAKEFNRQIEYDGVILTNLDGDARGGAALSIKAVTGKPVKFVGMGEKMDKFEPFYPERMADRILGMGDVVTLVEKAEQAIEQEDAEALEEKMRKAQFDLEDFRKQLRMIRGMGPLKELMSYIPGVGSKLDGMDFDESELDKIEAIINSMTQEERQKPQLINAGRRNRIAKGSGANAAEVNRMLKQFMQLKKVMKKMTRGGGMKDLGKAFPDQLSAPGGPLPKGLQGKLKDMSKRK